MTETTPETTKSTLEVHLDETRLFNPPSDFVEQAHISSLEQYEELYKKAEENPEKFWAELAKQELHWFKEWTQVLDWNNPPFAKWFVGGQLNISYNCLDRHLTSWRRNKAAIIWEGDNGDSRTITYSQLHREVCQFANAIKQLGVKKGDLVTIYLPMIPEAAIAMLACARIGAIHTVVFSAFSADALKKRLINSKSQLIITADGGFRKGGVIKLKDKVDLALQNNSPTEENKDAPTVEVKKVLVVQRTKEEINMVEGRDFWWHELQKTVPADCPAEPMDSEDPLFVIYTSGTTGRPKGIVHTTAGYNLMTHITTKWVFDLKDTDIYWCTADFGWITGHFNVVHGPLSNSATILMSESVPHPGNKDCFWDIIQKYRVTIFYTAPTVIRASYRVGGPSKNQDLSSLRLLGSVGEPISPEIWMWYRRVIGKEKCPIIDTWGQTETGAIAIAPLPGAIPTKPGSCTRPFPGIIVDIVDSDGNPVKENEGGYLVIKHPWPSMLRTVWGNDQRFRHSYWKHTKDGQYLYLAGDGARRDKDGYVWIMGRIDDVINVSGHRLGTMEIESALESHTAVAGAAVVGKKDEKTGEAIVAFVILKQVYSESSNSVNLEEELKEQVVKKIGAIARPTEIFFTDSSLNTFSGKNVRRLLRQIVSEEEISGDLSTLEEINFNQFSPKTFASNGRPYLKNLTSGGEISDNNKSTLADKLREIIGNISSEEQKNLAKSFAKLSENEAKLHKDG